MNEQQVLATIFTLQERKRLAIIALCKNYATLVIQDFQNKQANNKYWNNQSGFAKDLMFAQEFEEGSVVGFFMAHAVEYGPSLELANDGKHAALRPTMESFLPQFKKDLQTIW